MLEKPENYKRDNFFIFLIAAVILGLLLLFQAPNFLSLLVPIMFVNIAPLIWFKNYYAQKRKYHEDISAIKAEEAEALRTKRLYPKGSKVNENIARYVKLQKEKRAKAKWCSVVGKLTGTPTRWPSANALMYAPYSKCELLGI